MSAVRRALVVASLALSAACSSEEESGFTILVTPAGGQGGAGASSGRGGAGTNSAGSGGHATPGGASGAAGQGGGGQAGTKGGASGGPGGASGGGASGASGSGAGGKSGAAGGGGGGGAGNGGTAGSGGGSAGMKGEEVHVSGRTLAQGDSLRFGWSGVSFTTTFSGTALRATLAASSSSNRMEVIVDGVVDPARTITIASGMNEYTVVDQLAPGQHTVTLHRRTEGNVGIATFHGFSVEGGALVPTPSPFAHRVEIVGDSISCGYGTECQSANEAFSTKTENHYLTYGAIAGRLLSADVHTIAWSGKGLVANYGTDQSATMPELYGRTFATDAATDWDFSSWTAEAVIINLGTNDWNHSPKVDAATFEAAYDDFASDIESRYPGVAVFGIGNALVGSAHLTAVKNAMSKKPSRHYVQFALKSGEGICCQHPCASTHARWGQELAQAMSSALGW